MNLLHSLDEAVSLATSSRDMENLCAESATEIRRLNVILFLYRDMLDVLICDSTELARNHQAGLRSSGKIADVEQMIEKFISGRTGAGMTTPTSNAEALQMLHYETEFADSAREDPNLILNELGDNANDVLVRLLRSARHGLGLEVQSLYSDLLYIAARHYADRMIKTVE